MVEVAETLYTRLRQDILLGVLKPARKLKLEGLSNEYSASVNTLRETLSRLVSEGLVVSEGQKGFQVMSTSLEELVDITQIRLMLELQAIKLSLEKADLEWEGRLLAAHHKLAKIENVIADDESLSDVLEKYNREFHFTLVGNCGSKWLINLHTLLYDQSLRYRSLAFRVKNFPRETSRLEHIDILQAALKRDFPALEKVLTKHILKGKDVYNEGDL